ncbi:MAG: flagellar hook-basal body complex protein [Deltaproteobacteria bacterium]|jgi:flagellar hook protein FlgE|nr:flagellar hook-basal body complex protein [Deltaproteobacteria bacterium]MCL5879661.1 flagellar hook-basal body complex protein [Deltaproteobacteria bacterium]MDA8304080.1 flagellar hook-basal body complex protein [Deltaproteobacteria bacterium]
MGANALFTAVSGLNANQTYLGVIGNNIANSNTIGFKSSDPIFQNLVSQTLSGVSSSQEGLGTSVYSIQQQFGQGALETTSNPLNMAVDGSGFFIVQSPNGSTYYTRNGQFSENAQGQIVDSTGQNVVQGYPLNAQGVSTSGTPQPISLTTSAIPPLATTTATLTANLNSNISPQTTPTTTTGTFMGGYLTSSASAGSSTVNVDMTYNGATGSAPTSLLIGNGDGTTNLYTVKYYYVGATQYTPATLPSGSAVTSVTLSSPLTSSVLQNTAISQNTLGLTSTSGVLQGSDIQINTNGTAASSTVDPYQFVNTVASVNSNSTVNLSNAMPIPSGGSFTAGGGVISGPASDYYSTTINVYDSLGNSLPMTVTFAPSSSTAGDWNVYYTINGTAAQRQSLTSTTPDVIFNSNGQITSGTSQTLTDVPAYVSPTPATLPDGASEPLNVALNLNNLTQYAATSATTAFTQNGYSTGTLTSFTVDQNGRISGLFSNGQTKYLYQVALANFIAPTGLVSEGNSLFAQSYSSGQPAVGVANSGNFGYITDSALEQSNVNISSEFTNMIIAQNAYVANSKVLTTENAVLTALETAIP